LPAAHAAATLAHPLKSHHFGGSGAASARQSQYASIPEQAQPNT